MRRADRLFRLVQCLRGRRLSTAAWLGERLEVSVRTVYRDVADLQAQGVPIEGEAGVGYRLRAGFDLPPLMFSSAEAQALVAALPLFTGHPQLDEATGERLSALRKAASARMARFAYVDAEGEHKNRDARPLACVNWESAGTAWTPCGCWNGASAMSRAAPMPTSCGSAAPRKAPEPWARPRVSPLLRSRPLRDTRGAMHIKKITNLKLDLTSDLQKWRAFLAISECGSLTRAALFLGSNQSLLSRQLNALERECGVRLFNRTGRGVELSDVGQRIVPQVQSLLHDAVQLEAEIRGDAREPAGLVTLGALPSISTPMVGKLFTRMRDRHPAVQLKVLEGSSGQVEEWLADARLDIAILYRYGHPAAQEQALATVDSYLIGAAGDRLTAQPELPFSALDGLPFILPGAPNGLRTALDALARQEHIQLAPAIEADSLPLQKSLVELERLYTVLPLHAVWNEVRDGRLQASRVNGPLLQRTVSMAFAKSKGPARAVRAVADQIAELVDEMARSGMWRAGGGATTPSA